MNDEKAFLEAIDGLPTSMKKRLTILPGEVKKTTREVRIRAGRPVSIEMGEKNYTLMGKTSAFEVAECFRALCGYSVHSRAEEIKQGFLTIKGGHRAGISGAAVYQGDDLYNLRDISSINLRIAREAIGVSDFLFAQLEGDIGGTLIIGEPASGKTTILRDCVRKLSGTVSLIDTRGELAASLNGVPQRDVGNADVFSGFKRADGMLCALRTMAPDYIVCDELGSREDIAAVCSCMGGGAQLIATAHASSFNELWKRREIRNILKTGAFKTLVFLKGKSAPSEIAEIYKAGDSNAYGRSSTYYDMSDFNRILSIGRLDKEKDRTIRNYNNDRMVFNRNTLSGA